MAYGVRDSWRPGFSTARVFSRAFGTVAASPFAALAMVLLFGILPSEAYVYAASRLMPLKPLFSAWAFGKVLVAWAVGSFCNTLVQGTFVGLTSAHDEGRRIGFLEAVRASGRALFPLMALGFITSLGTMIGYIALIVPGVLLGLIWIVSAPVLVEEQRGAIAALGRSRILTQGARWPILGITLLMAGLLLAMLVLQALVISPYFRSPGHAFPYMEQLLIRVVTGTFLKTCSAAVYTSIYVELRNWKHDLSEDGLTEIFA